MGLWQAFVSIFQAPDWGESAEARQYREYREASARWAAHNERARAKGCKCGAPGTRVKLFPVIGSVPYEVWSCDEHYGVNVWCGTQDGTLIPAWERNKPCPADCEGSHSWGGPIGGETTNWQCTIKPAPEDARAPWEGRLMRKSDDPMTDEQAKAAREAHKRYVAALEKKAGKEPKNSGT